MKKRELTNQAFRKSDYLCALLVLFISFSVYLITLTPTVGFHDSGELITCAWRLGIAHPPGYPLYTLFGKLFLTLIPIGNIAYRMNTESALFASLTVMMVYFITKRLTDSIIPSIVASLILAFSLTFWEQAVIAEKYTLNAFFFSILIFLLLKWQTSLSKKHLYLFSFLLGLSFCHHFQTVYILPASIFFITAISFQNRKRKPISLPTITKMLLLFILPLTLWSYLPLRASQDPVLNWGDPRTLIRFIGHITTAGYKHYFSQPANFFEFFSKISSHHIFFLHQFSGWIIWIGFIGILLLRKRKRTLTFFILIVIFNLFSAAHYDIPNLEDYYIPSFILFSVCIGFGFSLLRKIPTNTKTYLLLSLLLILFPLILFKKHYYHNNRDKYYFAYDYARNILKHLRKKAVLFVEGDHQAFPLWYFRYVKKEREDVFPVYDIFLINDWYKDYLGYMIPELICKFSPLKINEATLEAAVEPIQIRIENIIDKNLNRGFSIYIESSQKRLLERYLLIPEGLFFIVRERERFFIPKKLELNYRGIDDKTVFKDWWVQKGVVKDYLSGHNAYGKYYINRNLYEDAISEYKNGLMLYPNSPEFSSNLVTLYLNLGIEYYQAGKLKEAVKKYKEGIEIDPQNPYLYSNLGLAYYLQKEYKNAISAYKKALELKPEDIASRKNLATIYFELKLFDDAQLQCHQILTFNPTNTYAKKMLEEIEKILDKQKGVSVK